MSAVYDVLMMLEAECVGGIELIFFSSSLDFLERLTVCLLLFSSTQSHLTVPN